MEKYEKGEKMENTKTSFIIKNIIIISAVKQVDATFEMMRRPS
ncbi:MAG: hypothetical protein ACRCUY_01060 [Thermoguttaceae bacterium]